MAESPLYRQRALDRLSEPRRQVGRLRLVRPADHVALGALGMLAFATLAWSVFGKVRVSVAGEGILLRANPTITGTVLSTVAQPALLQQQAQLESKLLAAQARTSSADSLRAREIAVERESLVRQVNEADARIQTLTDLERTQSSAASRVAAQRSRELAAQEKRAIGLMEEAERDLQSAKDLARSGALSTAEVTASSATALAAATALDEIRQQQASLPLEQVEAARQHDDLIRVLGEARAERDELETRLVALDRAELERRATEEEGLSDIRHQLEAVELELDLRRATSDEDEPAVVPTDDELLVAVFMDAADAKRVRPGMTLRVAPDSVESARYGTALGSVLEVSTYPVTPDQAEALLANDTLGERLAGSGRAVLLIGTLTPAEDTPSGYAWTTAKGPPDPLSPGTTLTATVTVERRRPITWMLPALRRLFGGGS
ncbi:MAG: hypothetical protein KC621_18800 [Myxococcales bacterium]|nr:hypothetical protein [Myxococcales bacterium]